MPAPPAPSPPTAAAGSLSAVPRQLRADPVLGALLGAADATVAVPESAQAVAAASLAAFTERTPLLVVTPTGLDAERLADDLTCLLAAEDRPAPEEDVGGLSGAVTILPAWETLPFERVSPEIETMGRRLAVIHALRQSDAASAGTPSRRQPGAGVAATTPPLDAAAPLVIVRGQQVESESLLHELVAAATGASTRSSTEGSSPCAAASSTSSLRPRTSRCASTFGVTRSTA